MELHTHTYICEECTGRTWAARIAELEAINGQLLAALAVAQTAIIAASSHLPNESDANVLYTSAIRSIRRAVKAAEP